MEKLIERQKIENRFKEYTKEQVQNIKNGFIE